MKRSFLLSTIIMLILSGISTFAQGVVDDEIPPLLEMLALVPDIPKNRVSEIYFSDAVALEAAFAPMRRPESTTASNENDALLDEAWENLIYNWAGKGTGLRLGWIFGPMTTEATGIDYFEIDRDLDIVQGGTYIQGDLDLGAVRAAFTARDYVQQPGDTELWCWVEGCVEGILPMSVDRVRGDIFGGDLGRSQPLFIDESDEGALVYSTSTEENFNAHMALIANGGSTLADDPVIRAAVEAVAEQGSIIQALLMDQSLALEITTGNVQAIAENALGETQDNFRVLLQYRFVILADVVREETQAGVVALVYDKEADAITAAEMISARLGRAYSIASFPRTWADILENRLVQEIESDVFATDDLWVTLISLPTARVPGELVPIEAQRNPVEGDDPTLVPPGVVYGTLFQALLNQDLAWLSTATQDEIYGN